MTLEQIEALRRLHTERDGVLKRLEHLENYEPDQTLTCTFWLSGSGQSVELPVPYIGAQWTVELLDVERRIRAAGGTI